MNAGDSFDDLRLTSADCMTEFGCGLQHARQAFEHSEHGLPASEEWAEAATIFENLCQMVGELEQIAQQARIAAKVEEGRDEPPILRDTPAGIPPSSGAKKAVVLRVIIFKLVGSKFFQASVSLAGKRKRITTRTALPQAAKEFAELAYRHFAARARAEKSVANTPPNNSTPSLFPNT